MEIKSVINQNEVTCGSNFYFKISLFNSSDETDYEPDSATVKFINNSGATILAETAATVTDNDVTYTLSSTYTTNPSLYNVAVVEITKGTDVFAISSIFHIVKQIIINPVMETDIEERYQVLSEHKSVVSIKTKIKIAFEIVKDDLRNIKGNEYALGMIDGIQIKELVVKKTIELMCADLAAGQGADSFFYITKQDTKKDYVSNIGSAFIVYDSSVEENYPDSIRPHSINSYR